MLSATVMQRTATGKAAAAAEYVMDLVEGGGKVRSTHSKKKTWLSCFVPYSTVCMSVYGVQHMDSKVAAAEYVMDLVEGGGKVRSTHSKNNMAELFCALFHNLEQKLAREIKSETYE
jgi:hypothetical protein